MRSRLVILNKAVRLDFKILIVSFRRGQRLIIRPICAFILILFSSIRRFSAVWICCLSWGMDLLYLWLITFSHQLNRYSVSRAVLISKTTSGPSKGDFNALQLTVCILALDSSPTSHPCTTKSGFLDGCLSGYSNYFDLGIWAEITNHFQSWVNVLMDDIIVPMWPTFQNAI